MSFGLGPGRMTRAMRGRRTAIVTTPTFDIRHTGCGSLCLLKSLGGARPMKIVRLIVLSAALAAVSCVSHAQGKSAPKDAVLYFVLPQDRTTIRSGFLCRFGLPDMGVTPAVDA